MSVECKSKVLSLWPFVVVDFNEGERGIIFGWIWWAVIIQF